VRDNKIEGGQGRGLAIDVRGELRYLLYTIYLKVQNHMYSYFLQRCIHCQTATVCNVPNPKKNPVIHGPSTLHSNVLLFKTNANPGMLCHGRKL